MVELDKLYFDTLKESQTFDVNTVLPDLKDCSQGGLNDVLDTRDSMYYQWLACLMRTYKPTQIVELGGAMGVASLVMLSQLPEDSKLFSITLEEHGLEFSFIKTEYPQLTKVVGNDLDLSVWPKDLDFSKTDLLFVDSLHTEEQVLKELELYGPLIKPGTVVMFDDIHMDELWQLWVNIPWKKLDVSLLHHTGFGLALWGVK